MDLRSSKQFQTSDDDYFYDLFQILTNALQELITVFLTESVQILLDHSVVVAPVDITDPE